MIVTKTAVPVHVIHPRKDPVDNLKVVACGDVLWFPPSAA
jgi:hypothetical protein